MNQINIYCDESNHLENSAITPMVLGAVYCPKEKVREINERIKEIKMEHKLNPNYEIKWTKISATKLNFYKDLVDYFFDKSELHFRGLVINKTTLNHKQFNQTHNDWYYKMYFELLSKILDPQQEYYIYIDIKDTQGQEKIEKLHKVLSNSLLDFQRKILKRVQLVRSHEINILQMADLLIGVVQFANRKDVKSETKKVIVDRVKERSNYDLTKSTLPKEPKFNIFHWVGGGSDV